MNEDLNSHAEQVPREMSPSHSKQSSTMNQTIPEYLFEIRAPFTEILSHEVIGREDGFYRLGHTIVEERLVPPTDDHPFARSGPLYFLSWCEAKEALIEKKEDSLKRMREALSVAQENLEVIRLTEPPQHAKNHPLHEVMVHHIYTHVKTGNAYVVITLGRMEADPSQKMVVYHPTSATHEVWIRPYEEFVDGRFQPVVIKDPAS